MKKLYPILSLFILLVFLSSWGGVGHSIINKKGPDSFPASMVGFKIWSDSLSSHSSDADYRKDLDPNESPRHYIDIDSYAEFNLTGRIASTYDSIVNIHGSSVVINYGTLPWATLNMYDTLKVDFQKLKWHKAMLDASDLGHYVADGHMPFHLTENYNGQISGQYGIHSRYETAMVALYQTELNNYTGDSVHFVSNANKYIFDYIYVNHPYVDSVLIADTYAKKLAGNTTSTQYTTALWSKTHFTTMLFHNSSHSLAELIYSAWIEAGSPAFGSKTAPSAVSNVLVNNILVYPNPTSGILKLTGDNIFKIEVCNLTGISLGLFYDKHIDLSNFSNGMYILSIYGKDGLLKKEKILLFK